MGPHTAAWVLAGTFCSVENWLFFNQTAFWIEHDLNKKLDRVCQTPLAGIAPQFCAGFWFGRLEIIFGDPFCDNFG